MQRQKITVWLLILSITCTIGGIPLFLHMRSERLKVQEAKRDLSLIKQGLEDFHIEYGAYPDRNQSSNEILRHLTKSSSGGPIFVSLWQGKGEIPQDPWGLPYCMIAGDDDKAPCFYSAGPNGIDEVCQDKTDDISAQ